MSDGEQISDQFVYVCMRFLSVSHPANVLIVRRDLWEVLCMHKTWNGLNWTRTTAGCRVAMPWHTFCSEFVHFLSLSCNFQFTLILFVSGEPDSQPDYNLACNGSTGGVPDTNCQLH